VALHSDETDELRLVALHEAGHHVVARLLGFKTGEIRVTAIARGPRRNVARGSATIIPCDGLSSVDEIESFARRRVKVLLAGALAQTLVKGRVDLSGAMQLRSTTAEIDWTRAKEYLQVLCNIDAGRAEIVNWPQHFNRLDRDLRRETASLVEQASAAIEGLSEALVNLVNLVDRTGEEFVLACADIDRVAAIADLPAVPVCLWHTIP
jgi:hypothetical protein